MNAKFLLFLLTICWAPQSRAQDTSFIYSEIAKLGAKSMAGRGYVNNGASKAARYLSSRYSDLGLQSINGSYEQKFTFSVNYFPSRMIVRIGDKQLKPGIDFLVDPSSSGIQLVNKKMSTIDFAKVDYTDPQKMWKKYKKLLAKKNRVYLLHNIDTLIHQMGWRSQKTAREQLPKGAFILYTPGKPTWSVAQKPMAATVLEWYNISDLPERKGRASIYIDQQVDSQFQAQNIIGMLPGTEVPDSFIVVTAHYDHLGKMGAGTIFPGASDNASGTAMLLSLAKSLRQTPQRYSILFIAFGGEELGLLGSKFFTENPLIDLNKIRFLINLDILGDASKGITVVNGTECKESFQLLKHLNQQLSIGKEKVVAVHTATTALAATDSETTLAPGAIWNDTTSKAKTVYDPWETEIDSSSKYDEWEARLDPPELAELERPLPASFTTKWQPLPEIIAREPAANSDHYYFFLKGVPSFFIYSNGGPGFYHDVWDTPKSLSLNNINQVQALIERFIYTIQYGDPLKN